MFQAPPPPPPHRDRVMTCTVLELLASHIGDTSWGDGEARFLPKIGVPTCVTALRPISIMVVSAKLWSRLSFAGILIFSVLSHVGSFPTGLKLFLDGKAAKAITANC